MSNSISKIIRDNVKTEPATQSSEGGSYRTGTAHTTLSHARQLIGPPHSDGDGDKVTCEWHYITPRGRATLRDYWWNGRGVLSIASNGHGACRWLAAFLRREHGIRAYCGIDKRITDNG